MDDDNNNFHNLETTRSRRGVFNESKLGLCPHYVGRIRVPHIKFNYPTEKEAQQIDHDIKHVEQISAKDLTELEAMLQRFGSLDNMQRFLDEQAGKK